MHGGVRRIEAVLERAFGGEAAGFGCDPGDRLGRRLHGVDAEAGLARMAGLAADTDLDRDAALMRENRLHHAGLAHHAQARAQAAFGHVVHQRASTFHRGLFIKCDEQMHRARERHRLQIGHGCEAAGDKALHVRRAPPIQPPALGAQRERVGGPGLAIDRHGIDMAGQSNAAGHLGADDRVQIGLLAAGPGADPIGYRVLVQPAADEIDQRQVGVAAGGVETNELGQHLGGSRAGRQGRVKTVHAGSVYGVRRPATAHGAMLKVRLS